MSISADWLDRMNKARLLLIRCVFNVGRVVARLKQKYPPSSKKSAAHAEKALPDWLAATGKRKSVRKVISFCPDEVQTTCKQICLPPLIALTWHSLLDKTFPTRQRIPTETKPLLGYVILATETLFPTRKIIHSRVGCTSPTQKKSDAHADPFLLW